MTDETLSLHNVRYNPEMGAFEARARVNESGVLYAYPVHMKTKPQTGFNRVMRGLSARAHEAHRRVASPRVRPALAPAPELRRVGVAMAA